MGYEALQESIGFLSRSILYCSQVFTHFQPPPPPQKKKNHNDECNVDDDNNNYDYHKNITNIYY